MFNEKELAFLKFVCDQLTFKPGQKEQYLMNEQILEKINDKLNKEHKNADN